MKKQILIIEDNYYKYFATKQVLESGLKVKVNVIGAASAQELQEKASRLSPTTILVKPAGGVADLLEKMRKRNVNRRNTDITIIITSEMDLGEERELELLLDATGKHEFASAA